MPRYKKVPVCKPCWELKYCPYGVLVELMPHPDAKETQRMMVERGIANWTPAVAFENAKAGLRAIASMKIVDETELWNRMFNVIGSDPCAIEYLEQFDPQEIRCNIFGHVCPVFGHAYLNVTETKDTRKAGRYIPRDIMLKVVRRDDYYCQQCGERVRDDQVEFDHVIPHSKGGPLTVENIRLLCRNCNREKSDSLATLLNEGWTAE